MKSALSASPPPIFDKPDHRCMRRESDRLSTFVDWPLTFIKPSSLAKAGFYYTRKDDIVRCAYCDVEVGKWEQGDDALKDHARWSPDCPFVRALMPTEGHDTCGKGGIEVRVNSFPEGAIRTPRLGPTYPHFAVYDNRLLSFQEWPRSMKQKPNELADAGFFYTGKGDQTLCFHCGGGLKDWEENDIPWEQHAIWFPKCSFLLLKKSREYVERIRNSRHHDDPNNVPTPQTSKTENNPPAPPPQNTSTETNTKEADEGSSATACKICYSKEVGVVFIPCGHVVACVDCAPALSTCAVCRKPLEATFRAFLS